MARTERFLPKNTVVTVRQPGKAPVEYTTKEDAVVDVVTDSPCPIGGKTRTPAGVRDRNCHAIIKGCDVWFVGSSLRRRIVVDDCDVKPDVYTHPLTKIDYDIPTSLGSAYAFSVARRFHAIGVRCSKSAWVIRTGDMPLVLLAEMEENGCTINADPIDPKATKALIARTIIALQEQVREYVSGANETLENETAKLDNSHTTGASESEAVKELLAKAKAVENRLERYKSTMTPGARQLGITDAAWCPQRLTDTARVTADEMRKRARAYRRAAQVAAVSTDSNLQAMAAQAAQSQIPVMVLAGALEDAGGVEEAKAANELNQSFRLVSDDDNEDAA